MRKTARVIVPYTGREEQRCRTLLVRGNGREGSALYSYTLLDPFVPAVVGSWVALVNLLLTATLRW